MGKISVNEVIVIVLLLFLEGSGAVMPPKLG